MTITFNQYHTIAVAVIILLVGELVLRPGYN